MTLKEAMIAPIKLNNAKQLIDIENSYIVRRSDKGTIYISKSVDPEVNYLVEVNRKDGPYLWTRHFQDLTEAVDYLNACTAEYLR